MRTCTASLASSWDGKMLAILLGIVSAEQCDSGGYPRIVIGCWQLLEREHDQSQAVATLQAPDHSILTTDH